MVFRLESQCLLGYFFYVGVGIRMGIDGDYFVGLRLVDDCLGVRIIVI